MILAFDHLTLSSNDFDVDCAMLQRRGFTERFIERGVTNPSVKRSLVQHFAPAHDLGYFDAPGSLSIEVINQGNIVAKSPELEPVFENEALVREFILRISDLQSALRLWEQLGFMTEKQSTGKARLRFVSALERLPVTLNLVAEPTRTVASIDTCGFGAPTLLSSSPEWERQTLEQAGFTVTALEPIHVGGKDLVLFFVYAPQVPPVEIICVKR